MKKIVTRGIVVVVLFCGLFIFNKCQKAPIIPIPITNVTCDSDVFRALTSALDYNVKLAWLRKYNKFVCNNAFYDCVVDLHKVASIQDFEVYAKAHPSNSPNIIYYDKSFIEMESDITNLEKTVAHCYEKHLFFTLIKNPATTNTVTASTVAFTTSNSCYSFALLKGIFQKLKKEYPTTYDKAKFKFCLAKINTLDKTIFKIEIPNGTATSFVTLAFDISDEPTNVFTPL